MVDADTYLTLVLLEASIDCMVMHIEIAVSTGDHSVPTLCQSYGPQSPSVEYGPGSDGATNPVWMRRYVRLNIHVDVWAVANPDPI